MGFITFSIVIPAHNEEKYVGSTLKSVLSLNYPKDKFEVIAVENGSIDKTLSQIKNIKSTLLKYYSLKKNGISLSKNFGASKANKKAEWLIFLDADTILEKNFLKELNKFLEENRRKNLTIGTARIYPREKGKAFSFWFWFYSFINRNFEASMCLQIAKKEYFNKIKYDEQLKLLEDFKLIHELKKYGKFFYISKTWAYSSTRRLKKTGGLKLALEWFFASIIPYNLRIKRGYSVVR